MDDFRKQFSKIIFAKKYRFLSLRHRHSERSEESEKFKN